jgi:hypothetical protein
MRSGYHPHLPQLLHPHMHRSMGDDQLLGNVGIGTGGIGHQPGENLPVEIVNSIIDRRFSGILIFIFHHYPHLVFKFRKTRG